MGGWGGFFCGHHHQSHIGDSEGRFKAGLGRFRAPPGGHLYAHAHIGGSTVIIQSIGCGRREAAPAAGVGEGAHRS